MTSRNKIFENYNYVDGLSNNRNVNQKSLYKICDIIFDLYSKEGKSNSRFIDICCGTGRFSIPIAEKIPNLKIYCLDSSENMLESLRYKVKKKGLENIEIKKADFRKWKSRRKFQFAFMSAAIHLFDSKLEVFKKVSSIQNSGDYFILRTPFKNQLESSLVYRLVPEALEIYKSTHPTCDELKQIAEETRYKTKIIYPFEDAKKYSKSEFLDLYYKKKHSAFWEMDEEIFDTRIEEIEAYIQDRPDIECKMETTLIIFEKE